MNNSMNSRFDVSCFDSSTDNFSDSGHTASQNESSGFFSPRSTGGASVDDENSTTWRLSESITKLHVSDHNVQRKLATKHSYSSKDPDENCDLSPDNGRDKTEDDSNAESGTVSSRCSSPLFTDSEDESPGPRYLSSWAKEFVGQPPTPATQPLTEPEKVPKQRSLALSPIFDDGEESTENPFEGHDMTEGDGTETQPLDWVRSEDGVHAILPKPPPCSDPLKKGLRLPMELYDRMYDHQRGGVSWLWGLHQGTSGGILGDDMGMGKTFQVTCFLSALFYNKQATTALVLAPKSVMRTWERELRTWMSPVMSGVAPLSLRVLSSEVPLKMREDLLRRAARASKVGSCSVFISTYGMANQFTAEKASFLGDFQWDYVVLDEGHKIKNPSTKQSKNIHGIRSRRRLLMTGTPIQNNLNELWALMDWVTFGSVLGTKKMFHDKYGRLIERGQDKHATTYERTKAKGAVQGLDEKLRPYLLQRSKQSFCAELPGKSELVVWVPLSQNQRAAYTDYLGSNGRDLLAGHISTDKNGTRECLDTRECVLAIISHLKKICSHELLVREKKQNSALFQSSIGFGVRPLNPSHGWNLHSVMDGAGLHSSEDLLAGSKKLAVLLDLVRNLTAEGHRTLVFSQSVRMLDIIETCFKDQKITLLRIDGSDSDLDRQHRIDMFNKDEKYSIFLLSTKVGGFGITLTGANRVVIYDPSWNPAEDSQAVDRAFRIGQMRDVIVYRMITAGTVEEKMYEKQVYKDGLRRTILEAKNQQRYFSAQELQNLLSLGEDGVCELLDRLREEQSQEDHPLFKCGYLQKLQQTKGLMGVSFHDHLYEGIVDDEEACKTMEEQLQKIHPHPQENIADGDYSQTNAPKPLSPVVISNTRIDKSKHPSRELEDSLDKQAEDNSPKNILPPSVSFCEETLSEISFEGSQISQQSVCHKHLELASQQGFRCFRCNCFLKNATKIKYNHLIQRAAALHLSGLFEEALRSFADALAICDSDINLQKQFINVMNLTFTPHQIQQLVVS